MPSPTHMRAQSVAPFRLGVEGPARSRAPGGVMGEKGESSTLLRAYKRTRSLHAVLTSYGMYMCILVMIH